MKPVKQTKLGVDGNCFEACLASILECGLEEIPYFGGYGGDDGLEWGRAINDWLKTKGLQYVELIGPLDLLWEYASSYHLLIGPTPKSEVVYHAVVAKNGVMVHDPHPDNVGLVKEKGITRMGFLIFTGEKIKDLTRK